MRNLVILLCCTVGAAHAQTTPLADQPVFTGTAAPGNVALDLSVEYPTGNSAAYYTRTYDPTQTYVGYFDPLRCYSYVYSASDTTTSPAATPATWFAPTAVATAHVCSGLWSGNILNWAATQTIDGFRWAMTGGYRVVDTAGSGSTPGVTVLEKAYSTTQGVAASFPDSTLPASAIAGATPFAATHTNALTMRVKGLGNKLRFFLGQASANYNVTWYNNQTLSSPSVLTQSNVYGTSSVGSAGYPAPGVAINYPGCTYGNQASGGHLICAFSMHNTTTITAPSTGAYIWRLKWQGGGARMYVNGVLVVNDWTNSTALSYDQSTSYNYNAGDTLNIVVDYFATNGDYRTQILGATWRPPGGGTSWFDLGTSSTPVDNYNTPPTPYTGESSAAVTNTTYEVFVRSKVCDPGAPGTLDTSCVQYGSTYKPEGLMQKNSGNMRFSVFSYVNDPDPLRGGAVLRAQQKFIGPTQPGANGAAPTSNPLAEWDATTGVMLTNPNASDASATGVSNSGAMNYLNKFGEVIRGSYKSTDPVSELYYASARYFKALGNVPQWSDLSNLSTAAAQTAVDGFPIITNWSDPIIYSCQKNVVLGIGDANTQRDKNVPGNTMMTYEPTLPPLVSTDPSPITPFASIAQINAMEGGIPVAWGTTQPWGGSTMTTIGNSDLIAGLAYDMHTTDIRPDSSSSPQTLGRQTVDTYWVDVQENGQYWPTNVYYMTTKYGGFTVPSGYAPYASTTPLVDAWWWNGVDKDASSGQKRPKNYFPGGQPSAIQNGLATAFAAIANTLRGNSTGYAATLPQIAASGSGSYSATFDSSTWTSDVAASILTIDSSTGLTSASAPAWSFAANLATQASGTGWNTSRRIATWNGSAGVRFTTAALNSTATTTITAAQLSALDTSYVSGNDAVNYLAYLRGDQSREQTASVADSTHVYRGRSALVGDIVNSKPVAVGPPSFPYSDATNAGYSSFKSAWASRRTVVYVGSNDGMLHAINGALSTSSATVESDPAAGTEMFAYAPSALFQGPSGAPNTNGLASLGNPSFSHHYMVDVPPGAFDVDFSKTNGSSSSSPDWRTIVVGGLGKGGKSYYALDVTDPVGIVSAGEATLATKVLWEFTDANLGYTYGEPSVVKLRKYGWVVIVPSGYNAADGLGHLFIINPRTGALLETVNMPSGSTGVAHVNAYLPDGTDGTAESLYAGDLAGNLWRVDVTPITYTYYPAPVLLATATDGSGTGQPITVRPLAQIDPTSGRRFVMFGTGRLLDPSDMSSTQTQTFYALIDGTGSMPSTAPASGGAFPITRTMLANNLNAGSGVALNLTDKSGWYEDLTTSPASSGPQPRVIADATTLYNAVAFSALVPNSDVCAPGGYSQIYAANFGKASTILLNGGAPTMFLDTSQINGSARGAVTDLQLVSVDGSAKLLFGQNNASGTSSAPISPLVKPTMRRLNWRELPEVN